MSDEQFYSATLVSSEYIAPTILVARFTKPRGFMFVAGQFVQIKIGAGNDAVVRAYSLCSLPSDPYLEFCIKVLPTGAASTRLAALAPGEEIALSAPAGQFILRPAHAPQKIFIATGTGIAPIKPMLRTALSERHSAALLFGLRSEDDMLWNAEFAALAASTPDFSYVLTLSQPSKQWPGSRGRVTEHVSKILNPAAEYYVCGSLPMVKQVRALLTSAQILPERIHFEVF